jgi:hypothetical protein
MSEEEDDLRLVGPQIPEPNRILVRIDQDDVGQSVDVKRHARRVGTAFWHAKRISGDALIR